jgi:hypothetical protein
MFVGACSSVLAAVCVVVACGMAGVVAPAQAQERFPATVTSVVDGDTVDAQVSGGPALRVRLSESTRRRAASAEPIRQPPTWSS